MLASQLACQMSYEKCFFWWDNVVSHTIYCKMADMSAGLMEAIYLYVSLSGLLTVLPYHVFTTALPCCIWSLSSFELFTVFCMRSWPFPCRMFFGCCSACDIWMLLLLLLLLCIFPLVHATELFLMCSSISYSGSVCLFVCFVAWYCMYASGVTDVGLMCHPLHVYPSSICGELYCVWVIVVVVVSCLNNCPMGPKSVIILLYCYSWHYGNWCKDWWSIIVILCCLSINLLWCLSS